MSYQKLYKDDYTQGKHFQQVLFRPSRPVQPRELNQIQKIQHNQTSHFADHFFKHGALVDGRHVENFLTSYFTIDPSTPIDIETLNGYSSLKVVSGDVEANVILIEEAINDDPTIVYIRYSKGGPFSYEDEIEFYSGTDLVATADIPAFDPETDIVNPIGMGDLWVIPESTYYLDGYFINVERTLVVGDKYADGQKSFTIGLDLVKQFIGSDDDNTLLDNAITSSNYLASGADRYQISAYPVRRSVDTLDGDNFIILAKVESGTAVYLKNRTDYSKFMETVAERTYDESGHYTIIPFILSLHDTETTGEYQIRLSPGKAYVDGYLLETISEHTMTLDLTLSGDYKRIDTITIDQNGTFIHIKGVPALQPKPPKIDDRQMAVYHLNISPPGTSKSDVRPEFIDNRRYTMRDIGKIEQRINSMEYYTTFSVLELKASETDVVDEMGNDRFKNGFVVDDFQNYQAADIADIEFKASLSFDDKTLHPEFTSFGCGVELDENSSTNYRLLDNVVMIDYDDELWISQEYATKHISTNPYFISLKKGNIVLDPAFDNWADTNKDPALVTSIVLPPVTSKTISGTTWGTWKEASIQANDLGTRVTDVQLKPYMRSIVVKFMASGMKSNIQVYPFFDDINVSQHCRPEGSGSKYGDILKTNSDGEIRGEFLIPEKTFFVGQKIFRLTNDSENSVDPDELITNAQTIFWAGGLDLNVQNTTLNVITPIVRPPPPPPVIPQPIRKTTPRIPTTTTTKTTTTKTSTTKTTPKTTTARTSTTTARTSTTSTTNLSSARAASSAANHARNVALTQKPAPKPVVPTPAPVLPRAPAPVITPSAAQLLVPLASRTTVIGDYDPVAQSFLVDADSFITKVDVFFQATSPNDTIFVRLVTMENGYPTQIVLGESLIQGGSIQVSADSSVATQIEFPVPIFVQSGKEYAIVVGSGTPDPRVFISKLGSNDIITNVSIETQPSLGSFFKSQNSSTWTASQYEDLKFNIYRARFKYQNAKFVLKNVEYYDDMVQENPFETENNKKRIRVKFANHAMSVGDKFKPRIGESTWIETIPNKQFSIGWRFKTDTGQGIITNILSGTSTVSIQLKHIKGYFLADQSFISEPIEPPYYNYLAGRYLDIDDVFEETFTSDDLVLGIVVYDFNPEFNGIPFEELNDEISVVEVDSPDSFIIEVKSTSNLTGFSGGEVLVDANRRYDLFNISGSYLGYKSYEKWTFRPRGYSINGLFENQDSVYLEAIPFQFSTDTKLEQPCKLSNTLNQERSLGGNPSFQIIGEFITPNDYISPVLSLETFIMIGVANTVDFSNAEDYEVVPNASGRFIEETDKQEGVSLYKYVTKEIILANTALDLKIMVDVYKPQDSDFDFYIKLLKPWDSTDIDDIEWIKIEGVWKNFTCEDGIYREVSVLVGDLMPDLIGTEGFGTFKVKINGRAANPAKAPLFRALRVIAVT